MTAVSNILKAGMTAQASALAMENVKALKKGKVRVKDITRAGIKNLVGIPLLRAQGSLIEDF